MNSQLKKGIVEVCVLATIRKEPSYGYKIISDISEIIEEAEKKIRDFIFQTILLSLKLF